MVKFITKSVCMALIAMLCVGSLNAQMVSSRLGATPQDHVKSLPRPAAKADLELGYCSGIEYILTYSGLPAGTLDVSACINFSAGQMSNYVGGTLYMVEIAIPNDPGDMPGLTSYKIWLKNTLTGPCFYEQDITSEIEEGTNYSTFMLNTPYEVTGDPLVIGWTAKFEVPTAGAELSPILIESDSKPYPQEAFHSFATTAAHNYCGNIAWSTNTEYALCLWGWVEGNALPANDLAATNVTTTTSLKWVGGAPATYNVVVNNGGTAPQSNFTVQLLDASDAVLGTQTVTNTLQPSASINVPFTYTFTTPGNLELKGKVILTGDENPANDISEPYTQRVYPQQPMAYCDRRDNLDGVAYGANIKHQAAIQYPTDAMGPFIGKLTAIEVGFPVPASSLSGCKVWIADALTVAMSNPLYEQSFTPTEDGWNIVVLDTPYDLTGVEVYIGWTATSTENYMIGCTENTPVNYTYGGHIQGGTNQWTTMHDANPAGPFPYNNSIIGVVESDCAAPENLKVEYVKGDDDECMGIAKLTWDAPISKDDVMYNVYRDGALIASEVEATFFDDTDFNPHNGHAWCVATVCGEGISMKLCVNVDEPCDPSIEYCNSVKNLAVNIPKVGEGETCAATLTWDVPDNMPNAKYNIYRGITKIASDWESTEFVDDNFDINTEYIWTVKTVCLDDKEADGVSEVGECEEGEAISELANSVAIYPNPTTGTITIAADNFAKVEIYNTVGQLIETKTVSQFDISSYNTGVYLFKVYDIYNNNVTKRVMVTK